MNYMQKEREVFERYFPGLRDKIVSSDFLSNERESSRVAELYREHGGPTLLVPTSYGGMGANAADAVAVHRVLGSISPSLSIVATMHDFTTAFLAEYAFYGDATKKYLAEVAQEKLYLASGFAEGKSGANILHPTMKAKRVDGGYLISGVKKPCSIADSMDYITASVVIGDSIETGQRGIAIVSARKEGIDIHPFWGINALAGSQSKAVHLEEVFVAEDSMFLPDTQIPLDAVEAGGFLWFELVVTASYLGVASGLIEQVYANNRGTVEGRVQSLVEIQTGASALYGICQQMTSNDNSEFVVGEDILADVLLVRFGIQKIIQRVAYQATEMMGGMHFIGDPRYEYILACCAALAFHPPSRNFASQTIDEYMKGGTLQMA